MHQSGKTSVEKEHAAELSSSLTLKLYFQSIHNHAQAQDRFHESECLLRGDAGAAPVCELSDDGSTQVCKPTAAAAGDDARQRVRLAPVAAHMRPMPRGPPMVSKP